MISLNGLPYIVGFRYHGTVIRYWIREKEVRWYTLDQEGVSPDYASASRKAKAIIDERRQCKSA